MTSSETPLSTPPAQTAFSISPLLVVNIACTMAMMAFVSLIGPISRVVGLMPWQAGASVTIGGVLWILLSRFWGLASDKYGRRAVLLAGVAGFTVSYWAMCAFIDWSIYALPSNLLVFAGLIITRTGVGAFFGAIPTTTQALIADNIAPKNRTQAMAALGTASAVGLVVGPAAASLLAQQSLSLPLYFTAVLPLIALLALWFGLPRQAPPAVSQKKPMKINDSRLHRAMAVAFTAMCCVNASQITVGFFALDRFGVAPAQAAHIAGMALTTVGVALALSQFFVRKLHWAPSKLIRVGSLVAAMGFAVSAIAWAPPVLWLGYFITAAGMGFVFPSFPALAANSVEPTEQGAAAGTIGAAQGLGIVIGPLAATAIYAISPGAPYLAACVALVVVALWRSTAAHAEA
jgi:DHA1 family tetracycline resistance protein-like MFS transporter